jgi:acyl-CoA reductase-like NAD-dependent aldehyde dehydrogenase
LAGLFTDDWKLIQNTFNKIEPGGLMVNDVYTFQVDHMPYGGVNNSGFGCEGLHCAIEEMTEMKLLMEHQRDTE